MAYIRCMKLGHSPLLLLAGALIGAQSTSRIASQAIGPMPTPKPEPEPDLPNYCGVSTIEPLPRETACVPTAPQRVKWADTPYPHRHKEIGSGTALANREARKRAGIVGRRRS